MSSHTSPAIELRGTSKAFRTPSGALHTAVRDLDLVVERGEFVAVVGPTGCGKSTTLTLVSGLEEPTEGEVLVAGEPVRGIGEKIGFVFQQDAVFPWRTVLSNVMAGPRFRGVPKAEARQRAREWLARVGLAAFEDRYPHQLSGGQRKRVALAATFVNDPELLLMDEPFSALDVQTRALMSDELLELWSGTGASVVFVTHDLEESIALADKVVVMTAGPATVKEVFEIDLPRPRKVEIGPAGAPVHRDLPGDLVLARRRGPDHPREGCRGCRLRPSPWPSPRPERAVRTVRRPGRAPRVNRRLLVHGTRVLLLVGLIGLWEGLARAAVIDPFNFSMPSKIWDQMSQWALHGTPQGSLWEQIWYTLYEALLGWVIGVIAGVVLGIALGRIRFLADVLGPYIKVLNALPRIVLAPIFLIWFGLGPASKVASAVVLVFFPVFFNAFQGAREVDRNLVANSRILGASNRQVTLQVVIPSATSWIFTSLHVSFGFALIGAIVGEYIGATKGLGLLVAASQGTFNAAGVYAAMVILAVVALLAEGLLAFLERRLFRWKPADAADGR